MLKQISSAAPASYFCTQTQIRLRQSSWRLDSESNGGTTPIQLALAWGFVGIPLLWGIYGTLLNAVPVERDHRFRQKGQIAASELAELIDERVG